MHPTLKLTGVQGIPQEAVLGMISAAIGREEILPHVRVEPQGQGYLLHLPSETVADQLLNRSGQPLRSGHTPIFTKVKKRLSLEDRFSWIHNELKCQEASSSCARAYGTWQGNPKKGHNNNQGWEAWPQDRHSPGRRDSNPNWEVRAVEVGKTGPPPLPQNQKRLRP